MITLLFLIILMFSIFKIKAYAYKLASKKKEEKA